VISATRPFANSSIARFLPFFGLALVPLARAVDKTRQNPDFARRTQFHFIEYPPRCAAVNRRRCGKPDDVPGEPTPYRQAKPDRTEPKEESGENDAVKTYNTLLVEKSGAACIVTLNRPKVRNAISTEMMDELIDVVTGLDG